MMTLFEFIFIFLTYLAVIPTTFYITEVKGLPKAFQWKPWICNLCLTFWTLIAISLVIGLSFNLYYFMGTGIILAIFTAIAMWKNQKDNTIKIEETND